MIEDEDIDDFLEHHGVRGMHWGTRRGETGSDSSQKSNGRSFAGKILRKVGHEIRTHPIIAASTVAGVAYLATPNGRANMSKTMKEVTGRYRTRKVNKLIRAIPKSAYPRDIYKKPSILNSWRFPVGSGS